MPEPVISLTGTEASHVIRQTMKEWLDDQVCPVCGADGLRIEMRLVVKPFGSYSIAGAQPKVVANEQPYAICDGCDHAIPIKRGNE